MEKINMWLSLFNYGAVSIFGCVLAASFCNILCSRRKRLAFECFVAGNLLLQSLIYMMKDAEFLRKIFPLLVHLPLVLVLYVLTKRLLWSCISVLSAYLCCQLRRWLALFAVVLVSGDYVTQNIVELAVTLPILLILLSLIAPAVRQLSKRPPRFQLQFGVIPAIYYIFDYGTTVYTNFLNSGSAVVVEFMPLVCCCGYLLFVMYYCAEEQKRSRLKQAQNSLDIQLKQSVNEINTLRESQFLAARYRHDLRHHLQYVAACIENGHEEQAQEYIIGICREIEAQKVKRYCENESVNLIFSSFAGRAAKEHIEMNICCALPKILSISDSDLCVLLSNALENAIHAGRAFTAEEAVVIDVQFYEKEGKLFLQVVNPCRNKVRFENGLPVSDREGHGIGIQSICAIVERNKGAYSFQEKEGKFILRLYL